MTTTMYRLQFDPGDDPTDFAGALRRGLELIREGFAPVEGLAYRGPADFVLQHGQSFLPRAHGRPMGLAKHCFGNAIFACLREGLRYVEGFALCRHVLDPEPPVLAHHGWNMDAEGRLIDLTWNADSGQADLARVRGLAYLGVEFSVERADIGTWANDATVLEDPAHGWPLLREPWRGEDFTKEWTTSGYLNLIRAGADEREVCRWLLENLERGAYDETTDSMDRAKG
jgi:hypothetical protein